jgi:hypothetical protein
MNVRVWTMGVLCAAGLSAEAADFDGSRLLICAPVEAKACAATEVCTNGTPGELGAPRFVRIDFEKQVIVGPQRTTPIKVMEKSETQILLMGTELGFGWTMVLDQESGDLSATLSDRDGTIVLFGSCTPL